METDGIQKALIESAIQELMDIVSKEQWHALCDSHPMGMLGEDGAGLKCALEIKATLVFGSQRLVTRIMQDRTFSSIFKVCDGVSVYTPTGNAKEHRGIIGYLITTAVCIHTKKLPAHIEGSMLLVFPKGDRNVLDRN